MRQAEEAERAELERRWEQRQAEVEEEKKAWTTDIERTLNGQLASCQQKIRDLEDARNRDQATIRILQKVPETRSRNLPVTSSQVQGAEAPDPATQESGRATLHPQSALRGVTEVNHVKEEQVARSKEVTSGAVEPKGARATFQQAETKPSTSDAKDDDRKSAPGKPRKERSRRSSSKEKNPSGLDSDPESSDSDASLRDAPTNYATMKTTPAGTTVMQFRPYVSSSTLDDFDEKASLTARRRWWERFLKLAIQGGWSDEMKVYELKLKMPPAVRNWRGQLAPKDRRDWKRFSRLLRREYVKSRMSEPERYYTMSKYKDETALALLYRLNLDAERADLNFRKSSADRERHIKRFIKKLSDDQLKRTLESQSFGRVPDLEFVLKQQEEVRQKDGPSARQSRDFRADNAIRDRYKPRRQDQAYVTQGDEDSGYDEVDEREQSWHPECPDA
ncbi:hypothetical protein L917_00686 [Phytophthora nicotianae]|uniref:Retrotransposon gag domain-containing protein n=1 Tax=Phytophthora nicotianae TaxID=4792 RepID=W2M012_PHYNI|nr:hypothetical protein L917_00686 [Phytophthora nicotianae]